MPGWDAEITDTGVDGSYLVKTCPEFVDDRETRTTIDLDTEACVRLMKRVLELTHDDYIHGREETRDLIEKFIRSKSASKMTMIEDPEAVIQGLRKAADGYRRKRAQKSIVRGR